MMFEQRYNSSVFAFTDLGGDRSERAILGGNDEALWGDEAYDLIVGEDGIEGDLGWQNIIRDFVAERANRQVAAERLRPNTQRNYRQAKRSFRLGDRQPNGSAEWDQVIAAYIRLLADDQGAAAGTLNLHVSSSVYWSICISFPRSLSLSPSISFSPSLHPFISSTSPFPSPFHSLSPLLSLFPDDYTLVDREGMPCACEYICEEYRCELVKYNVKCLQVLKVCWSVSV